MEEQKLEKLNKLLELIQNDTVKPQDIEQFLTLVLAIIKNSKDEFSKISTDTLGQVAEALDTIKKNHSDTISILDQKTSKSVSEFESKITELNSLVEEVKQLRTIQGEKGADGLDGTDGKDGLNGKDGSPDTRLQIVEKINTGKKNDLKIEAKQIEGFDKLTTKENLDRAISILDQRTQFLINKQSTGGSGLTLQTNGTPNGSQSLVNLVEGTNMSIADDGLGNITFSSTGGSQDLQSVTDVGNTTTNDIYIGANLYAGDSIIGNGVISLWGAGTGSYTTLSSGNANLIVTGDYGTGILNPNGISFDFGSGTYALSANLMTASRNVYFPDASGTLVLSVNGNTADSAGNITQTLQDITTAGNTTTDTMLFLDGSANTKVRIGNDPDVGSIELFDPFNVYDTTSIGPSFIDTESISLRQSSIFGTKRSTIISTNITDDRVFQLPDASGTLALSVNGNTADSAGNITISTGSGTVTSVAALTLGTTGTDLSSSVANSTTTPVITLNVPTASATNRGALSSTDWSTFNGKESALTFSTGLTRTSNTITANLVTGLAGGQTAVGGTASGENLTLSSTTNATKGKIIFGSASVYDQVNDRFGIGQTTPISKLNIQRDSIGSTQDDSYGILLNNTTAATVGAQQYSPGIVLVGQGWKTVSTAGTQETKLRISNIPQQGTASPFPRFTIERSSNAGAYSEVFSVGQVPASNDVSLSLQGQKVFGQGSGVTQFFATSASGMTFYDSTGGTALVNMTNAGAWTLTPGSFTTSAAPLTTWSLAQQWNNASGIYTGIKLNITNTASSASSFIMDLRVGGVSQFNLSTAGNVSMTGSLSLNNLNLNATAEATFSGRSRIASASNGNILLSNNARTSFGLLQFGLTTSSAAAIKGNGTALNVRLADDSADADLTTSRLIASNVVRLKGYTVAGLPSGTVGDTAYVTDALAPAFGSTVVGSGAVVIPVFYNGTNWIVG